jgi:hypothetical protein
MTRKIRALMMIVGGFFVMTAAECVAEICSSVPEICEDAPLGAEGTEATEAEPEVASVDEATEEVGES